MTALVLLTKILVEISFINKWVTIWEKK
jgi:hypothetical protein